MPDATFAAAVLTAAAPAPEPARHGLACPAGGDAAPPLVPDTPSNTDRYMARVEAAIVNMTPAERITFLQRDRVRWIGLSEEFAARIDSGKFPYPGENAVDYTLTIAALGARIGRERRQ